MKCSVGVAIVAVVVLLGSAAVIAVAGGGAWVFLRMSASALDPATLPPGADLGFMRSVAMMGMAFLFMVGLGGVATGVGLIRLWRWSRVATIVLAGLVIFMSLSSAAGMLLFVPPPSAAPSGAEMPMWFRAVAAAFYALFGVIAAGFIVFLTRPRTVAQFNQEPLAPAARVRPLSVTIIAWVMIVSAAMTVPTFFLIQLPAMFLGLVMTGLVAKIYYAAFFTAELVIGVGLLKRTSEALMPAIVIHAIGLPNAFIAMIPGVHARYEAALAAAMPITATQPASSWSRPAGLVFALAYTGVILYFLIKARRTTGASAHVEA